MQQAQETHGESGYAMAALLVAIALMSVLMGVAMPTWRQANQREKEAELVWRGEQYDRAVQLYRKKFSTPGPPNLDILVDQKFLRKKYKDPITGSDFELKPVSPVGNLPAGAPQPRRSEGQLIGGVKSKSKAKSIRVLNGRDRYDQWEFTYKPYNANPAPQPAGGGRQPGLRNSGSPGRRPATTPSPQPSGATRPPDQ
jgi:type II secretory pathway pseudopilin PulG